MQFTAQASVHPDDELSLALMPSLQEKNVITGVGAMPTPGMSLDLVDLFAKGPQLSWASLVVQIAVGTDESTVGFMGGEDVANVSGSALECLSA